MLPSRRVALAAGLATTAASPPLAAARPRPSRPATLDTGTVQGVPATRSPPQPTCSLDLPFTGSGPYKTTRLPPLEHVCASLSPACVNKQCAVTLELVVPRRDGGDASCPPPHPSPLAVFSGGFLAGRDAYMETAARLASWGFAVVTYDKTETALDPLDDVVSADVVRELCDYVAASRALAPLVDASRPYLCGHSRGGKLSVLAASRDAAAGVARVGALGLMDPVNNTRYAPQGPRCPSATAALRSGGVLARGPPLVVVGAGKESADCAPLDANYSHFFDAAPGAAWEVVIEHSGHFQVLDSATALQRAVCAAGPLPDAVVRDAATAPLVAWGRAAFFGDVGDAGDLMTRCEADVTALLAAAGEGKATGGPPCRARRKRVPPDARSLAVWAD